MKSPEQVRPWLYKRGGAQIRSTPKEGGGWLYFVDDPVVGLVHKRWVTEAQALDPEQEREWEVSYELHAICVALDAGGARRERALRDGRPDEVRHMARGEWGR